MRERPATIADYEKLYARGYMQDRAKERFSDRLLDIVELMPASVCEVGCGRGEFVRWIATHTSCRCAVGIDPVYQPTWPNGPGFEFYQGGFGNWPRGYINLDWMMSFDVLEHIAEDRIEDAIREMDSRCRIGQFHAICNMSDTAEIDGETVQLHLIRQPAQWWADLFQSVVGGRVEILTCTFAPLQRFIIKVTK